MVPSADSSMPSGAPLGSDTLPVVERQQQFLRALAREMTDPTLLVGPWRLVPLVTTTVASDGFTGSSGAALQRVRADEAAALFAAFADGSALRRPIG